jgi:hypothetical protein
MTKRMPKWIEDAVGEVQDQADFWLQLLDEGRHDELELQMQVFLNYVESEEYLK